MLGVIYFTDGHTEEILDYEEHCTGDITFKSESGVYNYLEYIVMCEDPYFNYKSYSFIKWHEYVLDWLVTLDIDHIEIYKEE